MASSSTPPRAPHALETISAGLGFAERGSEALYSCTFEPPGGVPATGAVTILIKCWDADEAVARFAPHAGFDDPTTPPGTPPRESIAFRTIAFFD